MNFHAKNVRFCIIIPIQICNENLPYIANGLLLTGPLTINYRFSRLACELDSHNPIWCKSECKTFITRESRLFSLFHAKATFVAVAHPQMAANTLALREQNDEKLFHLLAVARDLMKTFKKVLQGDQTTEFPSFV